MILLHFGWIEAADPVQPLEQKPIQLLDQNWTPGWKYGQTSWYHHASQGTMILPYDWFMALEQPSIIPPKELKLFSDPDYLSQFGFLRSEHDPKYNPGNLPIGFAIADNWVDPNNKDDPELKHLPPNLLAIKAVGMTCAACHTSEITYRGTRLRIEGGSAMINLGAFQKALGQSLFLTNTIAQRFDGFAKRALKDKDTPQARAILKGRLEKAVTKSMLEQKEEDERGLHTVDAGFGRTDALRASGIGCSASWAP